MKKFVKFFRKLIINFEFQLRYKKIKHIFIQNFFILLIKIYNFKIENKILYSILNQKFFLLINKFIKLLFHLLLYFI